MPKIIRKKIEEILLEAGVVAKSDIEKASQICGPKEKIENVLIELGVINEVKIQMALSKIMGIEIISLKNYPIDKAMVDYIDERYVTEKRLLPLKFEEDEVIIAMADPTDYITIVDLTTIFGKEIVVMMASNNEILYAIRKFYGLNRMMGELKENDKNVVENYESLEEENISPMIELVDKILQNAVLEYASDIHINPLKNSVDIYYRIDGILNSEMTLPKKFQNQIVARIKVMAKLDVNEVRLPQDGRIKLNLLNKEIDYRVSILPTYLGEKIVLRVLDLSRIGGSMATLGFSEENIQIISKAINLPHGVVMVSGPTGSGKSTTLYKFLEQIDSITKNIITVEDPVEMQLSGIHQVQVREEVNLTFSNALRSILRQDPDVISIGEIRDSETATIAMRSALTGHLVFSTIHTNSAIETVSRLKDMDIEPFLISSALNIVVAQRLVRKICNVCSYWDELDKDEKILFEEREITVEKIKRAKGCSICNDKGYKGRIGIHEILVIDDKIRKIINEGGATLQIEKAVKGMNYLIDDGLEKVKNGLTTIDEIARITMD